MSYSRCDLCEGQTIISDMNHGQGTNRVEQLNKASQVAYHGRITMTKVLPRSIQGRRRMKTRLPT